MDDTYVYVSVKLYLKDGQTADSIQEIIMDMDYSFKHNDIIEHEIVDILDTQIPKQTTEEVQLLDIHIDPFDLSE